MKGLPAVGRSVLAVLALTALFGGAYPLLVTGVVQLGFAGNANGSLVERQGQVVGSRLAAQSFTSPGYFHPRPSAAGARPRLSRY